MVGIRRANPIPAVDWCLMACDDEHRRRVANEATLRTFGLVFRILLTNVHSCPANRFARALESHRDAT